MVETTTPDQYPFKQRHNKLRNLNWSETGHTIDADIVPLTPGVYNLGTSDNPFASGNFNFIAASGLGEVDVIQFNTTPAVGAYSEGKLYYDTNWKTLSVNLGRDCTLQVGQEEWRRVYNNKNRTIKTCTLVYTDGVGAAAGGERVATIAMAKANSSTTSSVLGVLTQDIPSLNYGFVTVRGHVNDMNTNAIGGSYITTQGVDFTSLAGGVASNSYTIEFIDTGSGGLSYTDTGGTVVVNLGGSSSTSQNLVDLMYVTSPSTVVDAAISTQGVSVALAVQAVQSFSGGIETTEGDILYLSPNQRGKITTVKPSSPNVEFRIGRLITKSATEGRINVRLIQPYALNDLSDVVSTAPETNDLVKFNGTNWVNSTASLDELSDVEITNPVTDNALKYNGSKWINGNISVVSAGVGVTFFLDSTKIIPAGTGPQTKSLETLLKEPSQAAEVKEDVTVNNNTVLSEQYIYNTALGVTSIPGGKWTFDTYCSVDDPSGTSEMVVQISKVAVASGVITIAASGSTNSWATVTGNSPFVVSDYDSDITKTGTIITASGIYPITSFKSATQIDVGTLTTYSGETSVPFSIGYDLFNFSTGDIPETSASLHEVSVIEPSFPINTTDKLLVKYFGRTNNVGNIVVSLYHNGEENYTNFITPFAVSHNDLPGLQGGASTQRYHLSLTEATKQLPPETTGHSGHVLTNDGDSTDWALASTLQGTSGYSGFSGTSGYSGYSGAPAVGQTFYAVDDASVGGYKAFSLQPNLGATVTLQQTFKNTDGEVLLGGFITPELQVTNVPAGTRTFISYLSIDKPLVGVTNLRYRIFKRSSVGVETPWGNFASTRITSETSAPISDTLYIPAVTVLPTDRIVTKFYAQTTSTEDIVVTLSYQDATQTLIETPLGIYGTSGYSGASGFSGYSGYSGSGVSGYSGSGVSGYSGTSGYSGFNYTLVASLGSPVTATDTNLVDLTGLVWNYAANSKYAYRFLGTAQTANTNTGFGFAVNVSSAVTLVTLNFQAPVNAGASAAGGEGSSVADDTAYSWTNAVPAANTPMAVSGSGLLITGANTGTAQLRFRSETTTDAIANTGMTLIVEKVV